MQTDFVPPTSVKMKEERPPSLNGNGRVMVIGCTRSDGRGSSPIGHRKTGPDVAVNHVNDLDAHLNIWPEITHRDSWKDAEEAFAQQWDPTGTLEKILRQAANFIRSISTSARLQHGDLVTHRDTPDNNEKTPFEFTSPNLQRLCCIIGNYPVGCERSALYAAMELVQRQEGWISISAMNKVAEILNIPRMRVYEWCTFYTMCKRRYRGQFHVKVCKTTPCMLRGADTILKAVEQACNCHVGGLSQDGMFGVDTVECAGACVNACIVVVNDDYFEDMTVENVVNLINCLKCGGIPRPGPQSGRFTSEPFNGLTSLLTPPPGPGFMMQNALWR